MVSPVRRIPGPELVERERELERLGFALDAALDGDGRVALIEGPAGIGKSRLLQEARRRGESAGALVLSARAGELEREFPYGVVRQLFEHLVADPANGAERLAGAARAAGNVFGEPGEHGITDASSFAALHGLYWLTVGLAEERPLVLAVDDLHWCDRPSLRFLAYLVHRLEGLPVLVAATVRTTEPGTDPAIVSGIAHDLATVSIRPGPLSRDAARLMVRSGLGENAAPAFCNACHDATGGNPLLLRQLVRALEGEGVQPDVAHADIVREIGPGAVARTVLLRLARLPADALPVARAVAVLGEGATSAAIAGLAEVDERRVAAAAGALARAEILRPEAPLGFVHALVRDAVYREMPHGEREHWHARAVDILRAQGAPTEQLAAHLLVVPPRGLPEVARTLHEAGRAAIARGAADASVGLLRRALAEPPPEEDRPQLLFDLGLAETRVDGLAAAKHLEAAYGALTDPQVRGVTAAVLAQTLMFVAEPERSLEFCHNAIAELPDELADARRRLLAQTAVTLQWVEPEPGAMDYLGEYWNGIDDEGPGARFLEVMAAYDMAQLGEPCHRVSQLVLDASADGTLLEADDGLFGVIGLQLLALCDHDKALAHAEACMAQAHRHGSLFGALGTALWRGFAYWRRGDLEDAVTDLETALSDIQRWHGTGGGGIFGTALLAWAHIDRRDFEAAQRTLESVVYDGAFEGARWRASAQMEIFLETGRPEEALALAERVRAVYPARPCNPAYRTWRSPMARALHRLGRTDEAVPLLTDNVERARRFGAPGALARTLRELAEVTGDVAALEQSVAAAEGSTARLELARSLAALGAALRRSRKPADAREPLRRALDVAAACGAEALAEDIRTELYATGARPRTTALRGADALTASERRVATMAAEGVTNRDIAQALFVTPKTVEVHLSNAYRKLEIKSRRELAGALAA